MRQRLIATHSKQRGHRKLHCLRGKSGMPVQRIQRLGQPTILREPLNIGGALQKEEQEGRN